MVRIVDAAEAEIPDEWKKKLSNWQLFFPAAGRPGAAGEIPANPRKDEKGGGNVPAWREQPRRAGRERTVCWIQGAFFGALIATTAMKLDAWWLGYPALVLALFLTKPWKEAPDARRPPPETHLDHGILSASAERRFFSDADCKRFMGLD